MRVFATVMCILGCILFTLMSACFGFVGMLSVNGDLSGNSAIGAVVFLGIAGVLLFVAFLLGREAKRRLSTKVKVH
jgi:hypothetical protein